MQHFNELLKTACLQNQQQRLLLLFAKATPIRGAHKTKHFSGTIVPVMCVDKSPGEIEGFEKIVQEADSITDQWDFVLVGALEGSQGLPPGPDEVEAQLHKMSNNLASGGDLSPYLVLDRQQRPIVIS